MESFPFRPDILRGRARDVSSQAPELHERKIGITPFDCPCDNWTLDSIMWLSRPTSSRGCANYRSIQLVGNLDVQRRLEELLAKRNGVKIGADSVGEQWPFSELHLIANGRHDSPVLITGMRANVIKHDRPYQGLLYLGHPEGAGIIYRSDSTLTPVRLSRKP
jgi:hypothetical protein